MYLYPDRNADEPDDERRDISHQALPQDDADRPLASEFPLHRCDRRDTRRIQQREDQDRHGGDRIEDLVDPASEGDFQCRDHAFFRHETRDQRSHDAPVT